MIRRRCANFEETKAHDKKLKGSRTRRGDYVGDAPKQTKIRKQATNRRERREGKAQIR
jgi:hypothetical protein